MDTTVNEFASNHPSKQAVIELLNETYKLEQSRENDEIEVIEKPASESAKSQDTQSSKSAVPSTAKSNQSGKRHSVSLKLGIYSALQEKASKRPKQPTIDEVEDYLSMPLLHHKVRRQKMFFHSGNKTLEDFLCSLDWRCAIYLFLPHPPRLKDFFPWLEP